jgi:hypothetical protein
LPPRRRRGAGAAVRARRPGDRRGRAAQAFRCVTDTQRPWRAVRSGSHENHLLLYRYQGRALAAGPGAALPGAEHFRVAAGRAQADYAVVWAPPQQFMDEQRASRPCSTSARAWMRCCKLRLPPQARWCGWTTRAWPCRWPNTCATPSSATFASSTYEATWRQAAGPTASRACASDFPVGVMGLGVLGERVAKALAQFDFPGQRLEPQPQGH